MAGHDIGVDVNRVDRVGHGHDVVAAKDVKNIAHVALGAVGDKNLVGGDLAPTGLVIMLGDGGTKEITALLIPLAE